MTAPMTETPAVQALLAVHPGRFTPDQAREWISHRRRQLVDRCSGSPDLALSVSSGCAAGGARSHARDLAEDAAHALARLDSGLGSTCEACAAVLPVERLDAVPAAVRCTGCARPFTADTKWCR